MTSPISLVYYAAVAKDSVILAEYISDGNRDMSTIAISCLKNLPPLHSRFSHTTRQHRFICIMDDVFTHCAILDEALSKEDAFSFLQKNKDAFNSLYMGNSPDSEMSALRDQFLDCEMVQIMQQHALIFVGVPQREKLRMEAELQAERDTEAYNDYMFPPASPLDELSWKAYRWSRGL
ncbi:hypothetical protein KP509_14G072900 [Ceratopteris richardii]|uniref:Longin domain-containing protein n=1 Tax=Ceratopteris richardii TaxID=49495 RepID=A0A8T2TD49_CERRI|nr:hypothetical protein KP509_14G072900 [Ceratopteris richardii]